MFITGKYEYTDSATRRFFLQVGTQMFVLWNMWPLRGSFMVQSCTNKESLKMAQK